VTEAADGLEIVGGALGPSLDIELVDERQRQLPRLRTAALQAPDRELGSSSAGGARVGPAACGEPDHGSEEHSPVRHGAYFVGLASNLALHPGQQKT
jgi:hypothetical protein